MAVGAALGLRVALDPWLGARTPYITVFGAVIVAAWYGGFGPGLVAAAVGWIGGDLLFVEPRGRLAFRGQRSVRQGCDAPVAIGWTLVD
jgi:K+-sensing histidine kinase KdpD